jgi:hypothetical protein
MWNFHKQGKNEIYPMKAGFSKRMLAEDGRDCSSSHILSSSPASTANQRGGHLGPCQAVPLKEIEILIAEMAETRSS